MKQILMAEINAFFMRAVPCSLKIFFLSFFILLNMRNARTVLNALRWFRRKMSLRGCHQTFEA